MEDFFSHCGRKSQKQILAKTRYNWKFIKILAIFQYATRGLTEVEVIRPRKLRCDYCNRRAIKDIAGTSYGNEHLILFLWEIEDEIATQLVEEMEP